MIAVLLPQPGFDSMSVNRIVATLEDAGTLARSRQRSQAVL
jgi:hypothetical protein